MSSLLEDAGYVFPTRVGMNRTIARRCPAVLRVPHARGDEPALGNSWAVPVVCSPRAWG